MPSWLESALTGGYPGEAKKTAALLRQFADRAPSGIRPDFQTVAADYAEVADGLQGIYVKPGSLPNTTTILKLHKLATSFDSSAFLKAATSIGTWAQKNCAVR